MQLEQLTIKNFRCFTTRRFSFDAPRIVIEGDNGSGKSSLIEALYYLCYLKSFRTSRIPDMIQEGHDGFFLTLTFSHDSDHKKISSGFADKKKLIKIGAKKAASHQEILELYRMVVLTEHDIGLVQEGPADRRSFLDQTVLLGQPDTVGILRSYKQVVAQRNALLMLHKKVTPELESWTRQLYELARQIQQLRIMALHDLSKRVQLLLEQVALPYEFSMTYQAKKSDLYQAENTFEQFWRDYQQSGTLDKEFRYGRSLSGTHLDDCSLLLNGKQARIFASRGQQKLLVVLLKIAQVQQVVELFPRSGVLFSLDDFITDFDKSVLQQIFILLNELPCQIITTCPLAGIIHLEGQQIISM